MRRWSIQVVEESTGLLQMSLSQSVKEKLVELTSLLEESHVSEMHLIIEGSNGFPGRRLSHGVNY